MTMIAKVLSFCMLPISILIVLESMGLYTLHLPFDKILIGAILMIALQIFSLVMALTHQGGMGVMNIITFIVFMIPAVAYLASFFFGITLFTSLPMILGILMFVESLYALH